jgi:hypothetical protein
MSVEVQVQSHLACFDILECNWDQEKKEGYIEVDFGGGRISGFHCRAKELRFALQHIQAFGERCQGLDQRGFKDRMKTLYHRRLFCDLHKENAEENYVAIYRLDDLRKNLKCIGPQCKEPSLAKMYRSQIEEEVYWYLEEFAKLHQI